MKLSCNSSEILEQLKRYKEEVERKLTSSVHHFTVKMVEIAAWNTPLGDSDLYEGLYEYRYNSLGLSPMEGLARGGWQASTQSNMMFREVYGANSYQVAMADAYNDIRTTYSLGDTVYIGNKGPYIADLEANYSRQTNGMGIVQPTVEQIVAVFKTDFKAIYEGVQ